jgi:hypothetical protein
MPKVKNTGNRYEGNRMSYEEWGKYAPRKGDRKSKSEQYHDKGAKKASKKYDKGKK